jgi:uncharacterized protein (DUF4213/DUF364 family)
MSPGESMPIIGDLLDHLGPDRPVQDVLIGAHWTAVQSEHLGLASALREPCPDHPASPVKEAGRLREQTARQLCRLARSSSTLEASLGLAAINSLLPGVAGDEINAEQLIVQKGSGKRVAIIGHFPFVSRIRDQVKDLWVLERRPRPGDLSEEEADRILPRADVVAISATTLINHTLDGILKRCRRNGYRIMLGATTPFSHLLFDHGLHALCGVQVEDAPLVLRLIQEGATFRQIRGLRRICIQR